MEPDIFPMNVQQDMQSIEPVGIAPLVNSDMQNNFVMGPIRIDPKEIAGNILKNQAIKFAGRKLGLDQIGQNVLGSMIGYSVPFAPLTAVSALTGASSGIANVLRNKRVEKAIMRNVNRDRQGEIKTVDLRPGMQPTAQDTARGSIPTRSPAPSRPNAYSEAKSAFTAGR
jgi:hypothetical protein